MTVHRFPLLAALLAAGFLSVPMATGHASRLTARPPSNPTATPAPTATPCSTCPAIHVLNVNVGGGKNANGSTYSVCRVFVKRVDAPDEPGNQLAGATVVHRWTGAVTATQTDVTAPHDPYGVSTWVRVDNGPKCSGGSPAQVYTCTVLDVAMPGYRYAPEFNVVSSDSDDACSPFN